MLVSPDHRGINTDDPLDLPDRVVLDDHLVKDLLPRAVPGPQPQPLMGSLPRPIPLRQITPRRTGAQLPKNGIDHLPVIPPPPPPTRHRRQQWLNLGPSPIRQLTPANHNQDPTRPRSFTGQARPCRTTTRAFRSRRFICARAALPFPARIAGGTQQSNNASPYPPSR